MSDVLGRILKVANEAYENGEMSIDEDLDDRGDGLATFIRHEIIDVVEDESENEFAQWEAAESAMEKATEQIRMVRYALWKGMVEAESRKRRREEVPQEVDPVEALTHVFGEENVVVIGEEEK